MCEWVFSVGFSPGFDSMSPARGRGSANHAVGTHGPPEMRDGWIQFAQSQCSMLCVLIVEGMSVVVNVMLSLMSVMSPPPALCNLSVRTDVKLCIFGVLALGVSLVS